MTIPCLIVLGVVLTTGCTPPEYTSPHVIKNNRGGYIHEALAERQRLADWGGRVEIHGVCNSACAIFTTLPSACLDPDATIGFHRSSVNIGPIGNAQLSAFFRNDIKRMYDTFWGQLPDGESHTITAFEYVARDPETKLCD